MRWITSFKEINISGFKDVPYWTIGLILNWLFKLHRHLVSFSHHTTFHIFSHFSQPFGSFAAVAFLAVLNILIWELLSCKIYFLWSRLRTNNSVVSMIARCHSRFSPILIFSIVSWGSPFAAPSYLRSIVLIPTTSLSASSWLSLNLLKHSF